MNEVLNMLMRLTEDFALIKAYLLALTKSRLDYFNETWVDGQVVMQTLHISKRSLQSLRDSGTLPYSRINGKFYYKLSDIEQLLEKAYTGTKSATDGTD